MHRKGKWKMYLWGWIVVIFAIYLIVPFTDYRSVLPGYHSLIYTPRKYKQVKFELSKDKVLLQSEYKNCNNVSAKKKCLEKAKARFKSILFSKLFPFWYGTRWAFSGTTTVPGDGSIACGYFVTTILQDAGCKINRVKLAQAASEKLIQSLVSKASIKNYHNKTLKDFVGMIKKEGGVSVIGLDNHTGFLVCEGEEVYFIHSSGRLPFAVVKEKAIASVILKKSKIKVVGNLTKDEQFMQRWIMN